MEMDWNAAKFWLDLIALALGGGAWVYAWRIKHNQRLQGEIESLKEKYGAALVGLDKELIVLRARQESMPSHTDLQSIHDRISRMGDAVGALRSDFSAGFEAIKGLRRAVDLLNKHYAGIEE